MEFVKSPLVILFLLITGISMVHAFYPSGVLTSFDTEATAPTDAVKGKCELKDVITVITPIDGNGCLSSSISSENLYYYLIIVENRCEFCDAKDVSIEVEGYLLGQQIVNVPGRFPPEGGQSVLKYNSTQQVAVHPANATFLDCRNV